VPVVVVHGEAGIGKSLLVAQYAARAADRGSTVLWGACYVARRGGGQSGSTELPLAAETQFEQLGMTVWSARVAGLRRARPLPDGLTRREAEVLRLLATGLTNRQIGDQLVLSIHTVVRHLNNAYAKVGAPNRADAAAYAVRHGL
jgi:DNA-binding CsgD family transcriptional regulator